MRAPDKEGRFGKAWKLRTVRDESTPKDWDASLCAWIVNRPGAHAFWSWWVVAVVHLRTIPGARPPAKHYAEAEYEFAILSLDPSVPIDIDRIEAKQDQWAPLTPADVIQQFHGTTDEQAAEIGAQAVRLIVENGVSPDSDMRRYWKDAVKNAVQHITTGHPRANA